MNDIYQSPLAQRYASKEMQQLFSNDKKFRTWRRLWIALAQSEQELGLDISDEQIEELIAHQDDINYEVAKAREKEVRHDVMSHVYAYGCQCPKAKGIIHLGATSCYVGDNTDLIIMHEALELVKRKLVNVLATAGEICTGIQGSSGAGLYALSAGPADDAGQARQHLGTGSAHGLRGDLLHAGT